MKFLIYESTASRTEIQELNPSQLYNWVCDDNEYEKELEIQTFSQNAKVGESILSDFKYGYFIATRVE